MRLGGEDNEGSPPPGGDPPAASAYPTFSTRQNRLVAGVLAFFVFLLLRSHYTRDYRGEAETYLRAKGREEALEYVMPSTPSNKHAQEMSDKDLVISLAKKTQELEARIEQLEARQPTATSSTAGGGGAAAGSTSELEGAVPI